MRVSGRLAVPPRVMGKAAFVHLSDGKSRLQIYVRKQDAKLILNDEKFTISDEENKAWEVFRAFRSRRFYRRGRLFVFDKHGRIERSRRNFAVFVKIFDADARQNARNC